MSKGKFEYVRSFEDHAKCLPNAWIVVRINGRGFQRFAELHGFEKPNDKRALELMTRAASSVMEELKEVTLAYGASDEYSFVFRKDAQLYNRRHDKILTIVNSLFSTSFVYHWNNFFPFTKMIYPPSFDGRIILYPTDKNLRDYLSWRQADVHLNNFYTTTFWALVLKKKYLFHQAEERIKNTSMSQKNEILLNELEINYNLEPPLFRKGTTLIRKLVPTPPDGNLKEFIFPLTVDIIGEPFWKENPEIIGMKSIQICNKKEGDLGYLVTNKLPFPIKDDIEPHTLSKPNIPPVMHPLVSHSDRPMKIVKQNSFQDRRNQRGVLDRGLPDRRDTLIMDRRNPVLDPDLQMHSNRNAFMLDQDVPMSDRSEPVMFQRRDSRAFEQRDPLPDRRNIGFGDRGHLVIKPRDYPVFNRRGSGLISFSR